MRIVYIFPHEGSESFTFEDNTGKTLGLLEPNAFTWFHREDNPCPNNKRPFLKQVIDALKARGDSVFYATKIGDE